MPGPAPVVLLIEDESQMRRFLVATLHAHDYRVVEAATAKEGLTQTAGRNEMLDLTGAWGKVIGRIFRINSAFNSTTIGCDLFLFEFKLLT